MSPRSLLLATLMAFVVGCSGPSGDGPAKPVILSTEEYAEQLKQAQKLSLLTVKAYDAGKEPTEDQKVDLRKAAVIFDAISDYQPTNIVPYLGAGKIYQILGQDDDAIKRLQQGLSNMPSNPDPIAKDTSVEAHYLLSVSLFNKHDYKAALVEINKAIDMFKSSTIYYSHRAAIYGEMRDVEAERKDLEAALQLDPEDLKSQQLMKLLMQSQSDAYLKKASAKLNAKDYKGAVADASKGIDYAIYEPLFVIRAAAYIALKNYSEARKDLKAIEVLNPNSPDLKTLRARLK